MKNIKKEEVKENTPIIKEIISITLLFIISLIIIVPFKYFIIEPFIVQGSSMSPNYETGHYILINKLYDDLQEINRGDVLIFVPPNERSDNWKKYTGIFDPRKKYIKRVIGLPGETIKLENHKIFIKKKGEQEFKKLEEPYIKNNGTTKNVETILKFNEYFMLGDNRRYSYDSEEWGPIKKSDILGSPSLRIFPFTQFELNPAKFNF